MMSSPAFAYGSTEISNQSKDVDYFSWSGLAAFIIVGIFIFALWWKVDRPTTRLNKWLDEWDDMTIAQKAKHYNDHIFKVEKEHEGMTTSDTRWINKRDAMWNRMTYVEREYMDFDRRNRSEEKRNNR